MTMQKPRRERIQVEFRNNEGQPIGDALDAGIVYVEALGQTGYRFGCRLEVPAALLPGEDDQAAPRERP